MLICCKVKEYAWHHVNISKYLNFCWRASWVKRCHRSLSKFCISEDMAPKNWVSNCSHRRSLTRMHMHASSPTGLMYPLNNLRMLMEMVFIEHNAKSYVQKKFKKYTCSVHSSGLTLDSMSNIAQFDRRCRQSSFLLLLTRSLHAMNIFNV